jgi:hypothetical protein
MLNPPMQNIGCRFQTHQHNEKGTQTFQETLVQVYASRDGTMGRNYFREFQTQSGNLKT